MIETLRIANLAVVERADLEFGPGLNVLTGETGAGKSLVLGALALLAGARGSADVVREGASEARVEAVFRTDRLPELELALRERELEPEGHELVVTRSVSRTGRSRAEVAGRLVPLATLAELFAGRLEISSQHESHALRRPERHGRLLDAFGGLLAERARVEAAYEALRETESEWKRLEAEAEAAARREDFLAFQVREIDEAGLEAGELEAAETEHRRLRHAEELRAAVGAAQGVVAGDEAASDQPNASDLLVDAARRLEGAARLDPTLAPLAARLRAAQAELADIADELARYATGVDADPARLVVVEERLALLDRVRRKYGASEMEILAFRERAAAELVAIGGNDARRQELRARAESLRTELAEAAATLSRGRERAARRLAEAVREGLGELGMPRASLTAALPPAAAPEGFACGPGGAEAPELQFRANVGEPARPLRRVASGGELSRVFLALKNVLRRSETGMVLVFDEVDSGVGGRAADRVGHVLSELAREHQVLCITHLPQIAAHADVHLRIEKRERGGRSVAKVLVLEPAERVEELARMAGGEAVTETTRRHARELLDLRKGGGRPPGSTRRKGRSASSGPLPSAPSSDA